MPCSRLIPVVLVAACLAVLPASAYAQRGGGGRGGGAPAAGHPAPPPGGGGHPVATPGHPGYPGRPGYPGHPGGGYYRPYYGYPYYGYGYGYYPGYSFGLSFGYPYYYPYGYPYYYPYGYYGYPGYAYPSTYAYPPSETGRGWGGVRIQDAARNAQVYVDGAYTGIVDDFDGATQHLTLEAGTHQIELRTAGQPSKMFNVNITAGQTVAYHVR